MPRVLIAASGTGGHLFPAIAIADELPSSWEITWLGVPNRLETEILPKCYQLITVRAGGVQSHGLRKFLQLFQLLAASRKVIEVNRQKKIDAVFTTGGYIAAPAILGAVWCGLPVILHESNAYPGRVTRLLGRFCNLIALGLPPAAKTLKRCRTVVTGTPVRTSFLTPQLLPDWVPLDLGPLIVVMGGSQGAVGLNNMVREVLPFLLEKGCRVVHLTGHNDPNKDELRHKNFVAKPFSNEIPALLQHADLAISRSGAGALSELAICSTPAILVPYPLAQDQHQEVNASYAAELGAAVIVHQHEPGIHTLRNTLLRLLNSRLSGKTFDYDPLLEMQKGMNILAIRNSEKVLVERLKKLI
ncbi:UDP-N-acetylglucosamine--N-acetylmuramyl-(pentapeptide) pyrophosphoryl-undecaprenol N-acetylglucosamine transferase [Prochlorococcus sp. MIT 1307]|uniref:UDP-N-acetylglucosamine--N-acetylmuramyl- (pentapeptide) pyrophosphoryl-undecaprenol N-acetylglucosamine transferase n=1 Tax=Prochlorococcus sp. MIT 1307 TaxID=3096219 RepID=UPI002A757936|nr:UDP-N-acetylglucosamine--N-acetylmuramyl-(pentapeptide) pyrophosphoryl-undecaprenol N-acetylglucosamine transferase [Prochlorococcus sp. MIT 1307]